MQIDAELAACASLALGMEVGQVDPEIADKAIDAAYKAKFAVDMVAEELKADIKREKQKKWKMRRIMYVMTQQEGPAALSEAVPPGRKFTRPIDWSSSEEEDGDPKAADEEGLHDDDDDDVLPAAEGIDNAAGPLVMTVQCPDGSSAGDIVQISLESGMCIDVEVPEGIQPGDEFDIKLPDGEDDGPDGQAEDAACVADEQLEEEDEEGEAERDMEEVDVEVEPELEVEMPPGNGTLSVEVIACAGVLAADKNDRSDPYVTVRLGDSEAKTKTQKKTLNPVFNETVSLPVLASMPNHAGRWDLIVEVWDYDMGSRNDFLGEVSIDLCTALESGWVHTTVARHFALGDPNGRLGSAEKKEMEAKSENGSVSPCGSIDLKLSFTQVAGELEPEASDELPSGPLISKLLKKGVAEPEEPAAPTEPSVEEVEATREAAAAAAAKVAAEEAEAEGQRQADEDAASAREAAAWAALSEAGADIGEDELRRRRAWLIEVPLFSGHAANTEFLDAVARVLDVRTEKRKTMLVTMGELGSDLFFVVRGEVEILSDLSLPAFAALGPGKYFGEISLLNGSPSNAFVRSKRTVMLYMLQKQNLFDVFGVFPDVGDAIRGIAVERTQVRT